MTEPLDANAARFQGYADLYDEVRPTLPAELGELLASYCGGRPARVVDLGAGTGLSTRWAVTWADEAVGVDPAEDMLEVARAKAGPREGFVVGWAHDTRLAAGAADVVLAVQAMHWMEPEATLAEVGRLLRPGGVFAAIDCDWPPAVGDGAAEDEWERCRRTLRVVETRLATGASREDAVAEVGEDDPAALDYSGSDTHRNRIMVDGVRSWSKDEHLARMRGSGVFAWCRELVIHRRELGDADRFVGLLRSQGDYQSLRRYDMTDDELGVSRLEAMARERLGEGSRPWYFTFRCRLGVRA